MKDIVKLIAITCLGLFIVIIGYPVLHELGHSSVAMIVGAEMLEFNLFPLPSVLCNISGVSPFRSAMIGAGGMLLPFSFSILIYSKHFWLWYIGLIMNIICMISFVISIIGCVAFLNSAPIKNEDITSILNVYPNSVYLWIMGFLFVIAYSVFCIFKSSPMKTCMKYFDYKSYHTCYSILSFIILYYRLTQ